jgi:hypothetical protein
MIRQNEGSVFGIQTRVLRTLREQDTPVTAYQLDKSLGHGQGRVRDYLRQLERLGLARCYKDATSTMQWTAVK